MSFKIVQTREGNAKPTLTVVPKHWEEGSVLSWPPVASRNIVKLIKDPFSRPSENWTQMNCVLKRSGFFSYEGAEAELNAMIDTKDTDCEEVDDIVTSRPHISEKRGSSSKRKRFARESPADFNAFAEQCKNIKKVIFPENLEVRKKSCVNICEEKMPQEEFTKPDENSNLIQIPVEIEVSSDKFSLTNSANHFTVVSPMKLQVPDNNFHSEIVKKLEVVLENQTKIFMEQAKQKTMLENISKNLHIIPSNNQFEIIGQEKYKFPIENLESLEDFDQKLRDHDVMNEVISSKSQICGTSGKSNGLNCSYYLIDKLMSRKLLTKFSWCGGSRKEDTKLPFKIYRNFRTFFFRIILLADKDYSETDNETFFKNIIKNAKRRCETGQDKMAKNRLSSGKNRPKQLTYKKANKKDQEPKEFLRQDEIDDSDASINQSE